jgi:hypothetical protein
MSLRPGDIVMHPKQYNPRVRVDARRQEHGDAVHALAQRLLTEHTIIFSRRRK